MTREYTNKFQRNKAFDMAFPFKTVFPFKAIVEHFLMTILLQGKILTRLLRYMRIGIEKPGHRHHVVAIYNPSGFATIRLTILCYDACGLLQTPP